MRRERREMIEETQAAIMSAARRERVRDREKEREGETTNHTYGKMAPESQPIEKEGKMAPSKDGERERE